jgi:hypothetical protein
MEAQMNGTTPGPWLARQAYYSDAHRRAGEDYAIESTVDNTDISSGPYHPYVAHMVREADAHLIAAAPDLLCALQLVMAYLSIHDPQYYEGNSDAIMARAAIAEATKVVDTDEELH